MAVGVGARTHAELFRLPFQLACGELDRNQSTSGLRPVKIVADQHCTAKAVGKSAFEVNLFCCDSAGIRFQTDEPASDTQRTTIYVFTTRDRCESLRRSFHHFLVAPEKGAALRVNTAA